MRPAITALICWILVSITAVAAYGSEATIAVCKHAVPGALYALGLPSSRGDASNLMVLSDGNLPEAGACKSVRTGLDLDEIKWLGALPASDLGRDSRLAMTVRRFGEEIEIVALEIEDKSFMSGTRYLVPRAEVLPFSRFRIFGREGRVVAQPDVTQFTVVCGPGDEPAGVVLGLGIPAPKADLAVKLHVSATAGFRAQIAPGGEEVTEAGLEMPAGRGHQTLDLPQEDLVDLVIACPNAGGRLVIKKGTIEAATPRPLVGFAAWTWEPEAWQDNPSELVKAATNLGLRKLFISVPIESGRVVDSTRLGSFIADAHAAGLEVVAVEGDPGMISGAGRAQAVARARALRDFNAEAAPEGLDGVQYDIEPYLGAAFRARSDVAWELWSETLQQLTLALEEPIDAVVPFWLLSSRGAAAALERVAPILEGLTIMAYRTEPAEIVSAAGPLLSWSAEHDLDATVALEALGLADEERKMYVSAPEGELHVIRFDDVAAVVMLHRARVGSTGRAYKLSHTVPSDSRRVSFNCDTVAMFAVAGDISPDLSAWPSARGLAFHGLPEVMTRALAVPSQKSSCS